MSWKPEWVEKKFLDSRILFQLVIPTVNWQINTTEKSREQDRRDVSGGVYTHFYRLTQVSKRAYDHHHQKVFSFFLRIRVTKWWCSTQLKIPVTHTSAQCIHKRAAEHYYYYSSFSLSFLPQLLTSRGRPFLYYICIWNVFPFILTKMCWSGVKM